MKLIKELVIKLALIVVTLSILIMFVSTPYAYAKIDLKEDQFYYSGTTKGTYTVAGSLLDWLLNSIGDIADWLLGIITMGIRMVFVGWTALFERLLTTALESTMGVNIFNQETSSTDYTTYADSSYNITIEAIVYNRVPALNANFFDFEVDNTVTGTGHQKVCEECGASPEICCNGSTSCKCHQNDPNSTDKAEPCQVCKEYMATLEHGADYEPVITKIKKAVATWYYIIRLLAAAAMLIVLIFIGIKMAISTIASDKAVYKRMLIDWVVGAIILFSLQYFMIFVLWVNNLVVKNIADTATELTTVEMKQLTNEEGSNEKQYTGEELEVKIYETIRTRAYDARLSVGLTGMIMYMTLVYFAVRYTIVYLKRMLTVAVLMLMSPAVGVAYAMQKALSGKSQVITTWMSEFIMTIIIQIVHALIYSIFISKALLLSLESVSGMIIALVLMNYTLKADKLFRKIFKIGSGKDSLSGDAAEAGSAEDIRNKLNTVQGLAMSAKPLASIAKNTPGMLLAKTALGMAATGGVAAASGIGNAIHNSKVDREMDKNGEGHKQKVDQYGNKQESDEEYQSRRANAETKVMEKTPFFRRKSAALDEAILNKGKKQINENLERAEIAHVLAPSNKEKANELRKARREKERYDKLTTPSNLQIAKAHAKKIVDRKNSFEFYGIDKSLYTNLFGSRHYDVVSGKYVKDNNSVLSEFSMGKMLGITPEQKKELGNLTKMYAGAIAGMGGLLFGMSTVVAHPKLGMGMLVAGGMGVNSAYGKEKYSLKDYKQKRYAFSRFSPDTMMNIRKRNLDFSKELRNGLIADQIEKNHPNFANKLKLGKITPISFSKNIGSTLGSAALYKVKGSKYEEKIRRRTKVKAKKDQIVEETLRNNMQIEEEFKNESLEVISNSIIATMHYKMDVLNEKLTVEEKEEFDKATEVAEQFDLIYDEKNETIVENKNNAKSKEKKDVQEELDTALVALYLKQGIQYNPKTGTLTPVVKEGSDSTSDDTKIEVTSEDFVNEKTGTFDVTVKDLDIKLVNIEIDKTLAELMLDDKFDISKDINKVLDVLKKRFKNKTYDKVLSGKKVQAAIVKKSNIIASKKKASEKILDKAGLSDEEKTELKETIKSAINSNNNGNAESINVDTIMKEFQDKTKDTLKLDSKKKAQIMAYVKSMIVEQQKAVVIEKVVDAKDTHKRKNSIKDVLDLATRNDNVRNIKEEVVEGTVKPKGQKEKTTKKISTLNKIEALADTLDEIGKSDTEGIIRVETVKENGAVKDRETSIAPKDANSVLEILLLARELQVVNEVASEEIQPKKREMVMVMKEASDNKTELFVSQIEKLQLEEEVISAKKRKDDVEVGRLMKEIKKLDRKIGYHNLEDRKIKQSILEDGPILKVNDVLNSLNNNK